MEIQNLTDAQLNVIVSEIMGWEVQCDGPPDCPMIGRHPRIHQADDDPVDLPKFSTSLDACATFSATIADRRIYNMNLEEAVRENFPDWRIMDPEERFFEVVTATPRQRCIAFLRMNGVL